MYCRIQRRCLHCVLNYVAKRFDNSHQCVKIIIRVCCFILGYFRSFMERMLNVVKSETAAYLNIGKNIQKFER